MQITKKGDITEIDGRVRIEPGPVRRREIATKEMLSDDVTARHYQVGLRDAAGNVIALGQPMDFIDWLSKEHAFYVYQLTPVEETVDGKPLTIDRWLPHSVHPDEAAALSAATTLAQEA